MELTNYLIGVQGMLVNCSKEIGEFTKINYRGGNEQNIIYVAAEFTTFLTNKGLLKDHKPNKKYTKELNEIVLFLALNTAFKRRLLLDECSHLMNITPQLSKCLLANLCFALDLVGQYAYILEKLPLAVTEELLDQMIECLRKGNSQDHTSNAIIILKAVANKLSSVEISHKTEETVEDIIRLVSIILKNSLSLSTEDAKNMSQKKIYIRMGFTLLNLFELLLSIDEKSTALKSFLECVLHSTISVIKCVTLNVFCTWAEIDYDDQPLQTILATKAYLVVEKYQKNKPASELVSMLSTIARKPKTISELILEADVPTMIKKVNEPGDNQKIWFRALLSTPIFQNPKIVNCIDRWWMLCDESDVERLLTVSLPSDVTERQLIVKCSSNLGLEPLRRILTIYFHRVKFVWNEDIQEKLVLFFNKIHPELNENELKEALLLLLQNGKLFFRHFYKAAFKRSAELFQIFDLIKEIAKVDCIRVQTLLAIFEEIPPTIPSMESVIKLFDTMLTCEYYSWDSIVSDVILNLLERYNKKEEYLEEFCCCIKILKHFDTLQCDLAKEIELLQYIFKTASEHRCQSFFMFNPVKEEITKCCVEYIFKKNDDFKRIVGVDECFRVLGQNEDDPWTSYYKDLFINNSHMDFIDYVLPNFDLTLYKNEKVDENFTRLLKFLPRCVSIEWRILLKEIENKWGFSVSLNALTDILILLCEITENQEKNQGDGISNMILGLQFSLQNFGRFLVLESRSNQDQILAINNVCRVLRYIPDLLKPTEGMSLINILPNETLRALAHDKEFVARIVIINDKQLCKVLAQKVLGIC